MSVVLKDISAARWQDTGGIPFENIIANMQALADAANTPGCVQIAIGASGMHTLVCGLHPPLKLSQAYMMLGGSLNADVSIRIVTQKANMVGIDLIDPTTFKATEGRGKVRICGMRDQIVARNEDVQIVYDGNQAVTINTIFEQVN